MTLGGLCGQRSYPESVARLRAALGSDRQGALVWPALEPARLGRMPLPNAAAPGFVYLAGACGGPRRRRRRPRPGRGRAPPRRRGQRDPGPGRVPRPSRGAGPPIRGFVAIWGDGPRIAAMSLHPRPARGRAASPRSFPPIPLRPARRRAASGSAAGATLAPPACRPCWSWSSATRPPAGGWARRGRGRSALRRRRRGGRRAGGAARRRARARGGRPRFLALPSRTGLPVVCAMSRDRDGGRGSRSG